MPVPATQILNQKDSWEGDRLLEALEDFRRGVSDAPLLRKWSEAEPRASDVEQQRPMTFVLSTDEVDRHGDIVAADGWNLESYRTNPVFLWAHDYARPVIGRAVETWLEPHRLLARVEFAPTQFAQEVAGLYRAGYQRGVSVGFKPLRYEERRHEKSGALLGLRFLEQELLEVSAVPVPANRNALRRTLDEAPRVAGYLRLKGLSRANDYPDYPGGYSQNAAKASTKLDDLWPLISARIDELAKLARELAETAEEIPATGATPASQPVSELDYGTDVLGLLAALRENFI